MPKNLHSFVSSNRRDRGFLDCRSEQPMKFVPSLVLFHVFGFAVVCNGQVRGAARPLVKSGGAVNPHLFNLEKQEILRLKKEMQTQQRGMQDNTGPGTRKQRRRRTAAK